MTCTWMDKSEQVFSLSASSQLWADFFRLSQNCHDICQSGTCLFAFSRGVSSTEFGDLEALCKGVVKEKQPFERLEISKETLLKMFKVRESTLSICFQTSACLEEFKLEFRYHSSFGNYEN